MQKWVVLALGAVLAVGGLVSIWQGSDIIQIERGWTQVIAGTVALAGGVVTLALYAVIAQLEQLAAGGLALRPQAEAAPEQVPETAVETAVAAASEPPSAPVFARETAKAAPLASVAEAPALEPLPEPAVSESTEPAEGLAAVRGLRFRRRAKPAAPETPAPQEEPVLPAEPALRDAPLAPVAVPEPPARRVSWPRRPKATIEPQVPTDVMPPDLAPPVAAPVAPGVAAELPDAAAKSWPAPSIEPPVAPEPAQPEEPARPAAATHDWLERALAGEDEAATEPAFSWLRTAAETPPAASVLREPAAHEPVQETAQEPAQEPVPEPVHEPEPASAPEPTVVGRYSSDGADYTLYSDGSIEAHTPQGHFRFASMADLRAHIEAHAGGASRP
jgi:hypothetical protein